MHLCLYLYDDNHVTTHSDTAPWACQQRQHSCGVYNYDPTSTQLQFDRRSTPIRSGVLKVPHRPQWRGTAELAMGHERVEENFFEK